MDKLSFERRLLKPDEQILWSAYITNAQLAKARREDVRMSCFIIALLALFATVLSYRTYINLSTNTNYSHLFTLSLAVFAIAFISGILWLIYRFVKELIEPSKDKEPRYYAITNTRMVAADQHGKTMYQMTYAEMEFLIELNRKDQILVSRVGDAESTNGFFIHLVDDTDTPRKLIETILNDKFHER